MDSADKITFGTAGMLLLLFILVFLASHGALRRPVPRTTPASVKVTATTTQTAASAQRAVTCATTPVWTGTEAAITRWCIAPRHKRVKHKRRHTHAHVVVTTTPGYVPDRLEYLIA